MGPPSLLPLVTRPEVATGSGLPLSLDLLPIILAGGLVVVIGLALIRTRRRAAAVALRTVSLEERLRTETAARQRAEQAQRKTEERYRTPADQVKNYAIFIMDDQGRHRSWNEGVRAAARLREDGVPCRPSADLFTPRTAPPVSRSRS